MAKHFYPELIELYDYGHHYIHDKICELSLTHDFIM